MYYYSNGEYESAAALFYAGTLLDGTTEDANQLAYCYYNLACTISLLYGTDKNYSNLDECLHYLERSFELREDRIARAKEDRDFDNIRNTQAFKDLIEEWQSIRQEEDNE